MVALVCREEGIRSLNQRRKRNMNVYACMPETNTTGHKMFIKPKQQDTEMTICSYTSEEKMDLNISIPVKKFKEMTLKEAEQETSSNTTIDLSSTFSFESLDSGFQSFPDKPQLDVEEYNERLTRTMSYCSVHPQLGESLLHSAILAGNESLAVSMIEDMVSYEYLSVQNHNRETPLHLAVLCNMPELSRTIIAHGAEVCTRSKMGDTPLHLACRNGLDACVQVLTKHLVYEEVKELPYKLPFRLIPQDLELRNYEGLTCLHLAILHNHKHIAEYLVKNLCANIDTQEGKSGKTALHLAIENNNYDLVRFLVQTCHANVNVPMYNNRTALDIALDHGYENLERYLLNAGARISDVYSDCDEYSDCDMAT